MTAELILDSQSQLGEGALWQYKTGELYWIDIEAGLFHIFNPKSGENRTVDTGQRIGTVVPDLHGNALAALQDGIYRVDIPSGALTPVAGVLYDPTRYRYNDGKCDAGGRLYVGSMVLDAPPQTGALYMLDTDCTITEKIGGLTISNGIVWSLDNQRVYFIDTRTQQIARYVYDSDTGDLVFRDVAVTIPDNMGHPDGMSIDSDGMLWVAHFGGFGVYRWNPENGELLEKIDLPCPNVTSCAFGGDDLRTLYITTARHKMSADDLRVYSRAGGLFAVKTAVQGVPCNFYGA